MDINKLLSADTILVDLTVKKKELLLNQMIDKLQSFFSEEELKQVREAVFDREKIMSTGVGKGLAIPHAKTNVTNESHAVFARMQEPIEFNAVDSMPVSMVFLLVGPLNSNKLHIRLLSRISRLMNSSGFRDTIMECGSAEEILEAFTKEEQKFFPAST